MKNKHFLPLPANFRNDRRMKRAMKDLGAVGYGIIVWLFERLRCEQGFKYPIRDLDLLADELNISMAILQTVISKYDFFAVVESDDGEMFISPLLMDLMEPYLKKVESNRIAGEISAAKKAQRQNEQLKHLSFSLIDSTKHVLNECSTHVEQKRIEKKIKKKKTQIPILDIKENENNVVVTYPRYWTSCKPATYCTP